MKYLKDEVELKKILIAKMKETGKDTYRCDGLLIRIVREKESVRIKKIKEKKGE